MSKFEPALRPVLTGLGVGCLAGCLAIGAARAAEPAAMAPEPGEPLAEPVREGLRAGDWLIRGRITGAIPTEQSARISVIGGRVETPAAVLPDADITYFLTDHIAIEAQAGAVRTRPVIRDSLVGDIRIGSVWNAAATAIVQYHFLPEARFNPYLGVGVAAATPIAIEPAAGIPDFTLKSQASLLLQAGFDYHIAGNWFGNAMVKYVFLPRQSYALQGVKVDADLKMLFVGAGLGYRF